MDLGELHQLILSNRSLIANTWQFFISVHLALFGLLSLLSRGATDGRWRIILLLPFYWGFMFLNYRAQVDNYNYADALISAVGDIEASGQGTASILEATTSPGWVIAYLLPIYAATGVVCTLALVVLALYKQRER
eukprot:TRINITY_DN13914_c0_g1_i1.p1 TRINITY_DN13914_c0_g1~~TRINITY_DN13914_c0_g1_i1.p1  ORF type:complete len:135 (-),score=14.61 TRINITY_DN13914_c0_g1_i1:72-476(-)